MNKTQAQKQYDKLAAEILAGKDLEKVGE